VRRRRTKVCSKEGVVMMMVMFIDGCSVLRGIWGSILMGFFFTSVVCLTFTYLVLHGHRIQCWKTIQTCNHDLLR
jgi:hypothetical protein